VTVRPLRLEEALRKQAAHDGDGALLLKKYVAVEDYLKTEYYPWIQANCPFFTDHGEPHIESVEEAIRLLLRRQLDPKDLSLSPIDLFLLLSAAIWHDWCSDGLSMLSKSWQ